MSESSQIYQVRCAPYMQDTTRTTDSILARLAELGTVDLAIMHGSEVSEVTAGKPFTDLAV